MRYLHQHVDHDSYCTVLDTEHVGDGPGRDDGVYLVKLHNIFPRVVATIRALWAENATLSHALEQASDAAAEDRRTDRPPRTTASAAALQAGLEIRRAGRAERDLRDAIYWLLRAYQSGHREGWEPGPSVQETMDGLWIWLRNHEYDPTSAPAKRLLQRRRVPL
jgi:hypothetical protein